MGDDALAEFLGRYVTWALEVYLSAKQGMQAMAPFNPFFSAPFAPRPGVAPAPAPAAGSGEVAELRRELDELKKSLKKRRR